MASIRGPLLVLGCGVLLYLLFTGYVFLTQRSMLYFPSHHPSDGRLSPWQVDGRVVGFARELPRPGSIWLLAHGNAGQAADREYVLPCLPSDAALYVVEYPGFGARPGHPTADSLNQAVAEAYLHLVQRFHGIPIGVIGESLGSGPACGLARLQPPPRKIVLVTPFDTLASVAARRMPFLPVRLMLRDNWDNVAALKSFRGPVDIFGARLDTVIPVDHARNLASATGAHFNLIESDHNNWSDRQVIRIE